MTTALLTIDEVAVRLRTTTRRVLKAIRDGKLQGVEGLDGWLVKPEEVASFIAARSTVARRPIPGATLRQIGLSAARRARRARDRVTRGGSAASSGGTRGA